MAKTGLSEPLTLLHHGEGVVLIPTGTPLARLNYFDGKFLRAEDLEAEQEYVRQLVRMSNQAGGAGVVHGFGLTRLAGNRLRLGGGLATDGGGRMLFLPDARDVSIAELMEKSARQGSAPRTEARAGDHTGFAACDVVSEEEPPTAIPGVALHLIGISHSEALCGQEDVFGTLCEEACVTGTQRPWRIEGVLLRALPLQLRTPLVTSTAVALAEVHLRSRVASAYFADEALEVPHLISRVGLASGIWCGGAAVAGGSFVPLGVLASSGGATLFLDAWTARRERMDAPPRAYWQRRMMMRPWSAFLAQVLQFQCQLRDAVADPIDLDDDPCEPLRRLVVEASDVMERLDGFLRRTTDRLAHEVVEGGGTLALPGGEAELQALRTKLVKAKDSITLKPSNRVLISRGILELPPGGYLPVVPSAALPVNDQVRALMGEGVDLRFCVVRPDYVAHALEEVQHMDRISLLKGLDDPERKDEVDILVPDGEIAGAPGKGGAGWEVRLRRTDPQVAAPGLAAINVASMRDAADLYARPPLERRMMSGAARTQSGPDGPPRFVFAGLAELPSQRRQVDELREWARESHAEDVRALWRAVELGGRSAANRAGPSAAEMASTMARLRAEAERFRTTGGAAREAGRRRLSTNFVGLPEQEAPDHIALWLDARLDDDPFASAEGATIPGGFDLLLLMPNARGSSFVFLTLTAKLEIEAITRQAGAEIVQARLSGSATVQIDAFELGMNHELVEVDARVVLTRAAQPGGSMVSVEFGMEKPFLGMVSGGGRLQWSSSPVTATLLIGLHDAQGTILQLAASMARSDEALRPGNAFRMASETAVTVLATREAGANLPERAAKDLFGAPPQEDEELVVRATRDWVLFHRRRTRRCGIDKPPPAPVAARRYQVFHLRVEDAGEARTARAAVLSGRAERVREAGFKPVTVVEFEGGRSSLVTAPAALLADWQQAEPGKLIYDAVGSQGAAQGEGEALARARLATVQTTIAQGAPAAEVETEVLAMLPGPGLTELDGAIFAVTQVVCHAVFTVNVDGFERIRQAEQGASVKGLLEQFDAVKVGEVPFSPDGTAVLDGEALRATWRGLGLEVPRRALAIAPGVAADAERAGLVRKQAQAVLRTLGSDGDSLPPREGEIRDVTRCAAITVMQAAREG